MDRNELRISSCIASPSEIVHAGRLRCYLVGRIDQRVPHILREAVGAVSIEDVEDVLKFLFQSRPQVLALEPNSFSEIWRDIKRVASRCGMADFGRMAAGNWISELTGETRCLRKVPS